MGEFGISPNPIVIIKEIQTKKIKVIIYKRMEKVFFLRKYKLTEKVLILT
jgi:hypothetical protein